jgi:hypothetical protein
MFKRKLTNFIGTLSEDKQRDLDHALAYALQIVVA